jgi:hypothetical protein
LEELWNGLAAKGALGKNFSSRSCEEALREYDGDLDQWFGIPRIASALPSELQPRTWPDVLTPDFFVATWLHFSIFLEKY